MKHFLLPLTITGFLILGCDSKANTNFKDKIKGEWYLNKWTVYNKLIFYDSTVFVDNHVDTVFTLNYRVSNDTLTTWNNYNEYKNRIISLDDSTLILDGIHDLKEKLIYTKTFKGWLSKK